MSDQGMVFIRQDDYYVRIRYLDILYLQAKGSYCVCVSKNREIILAMNLKNLLSKLESTYFVKIHRSYAVNITNIDRFDNNSVQIGKRSLPISASYRSSFMKNLIRI